MKINKEDFIRVPKGWGGELWIVNKPQYCGKILYFEEGKKCSFHKHELKDETFFILSGTIELRYGNSDNYDDSEVVILEKGEGFHVPVGLRHQMRAIDGPAEMLEVSTQHFDSDSIRVIKGD